MSVDVTVSVSPLYGGEVPIQPRRYVSTLTPEAQDEIPPVVTAEHEAWVAWQDALDVRDDVLRRHYAAGVDPRDLALLTIGRNGKPMSRQQVHRIVRGARGGE